MTELVLGPPQEYDIKKEMIEIGYFLAFAVFASLFSVIFVGLVQQAFTEAKFKDIYLFYGPFLFFLVGILALKIIEVYSKGEKAEVVIHDTKTLPAFIGKVFTFVNKPILLILSSIVVTGWISFLGAAFNIFFFPAKQSTQQLTEFANFWSYIEPAVTVESFLLFFIIGMELTILTLIFRKLKISNKILYTIASLIIFSVINGFLWMNLHRIRYGATEGSMLYTFFFGALGTFLTLALGSVIFFWVWHYTNNGFLALKLVYGKEIFLSFSVIGLIILTIITIYFIYRFYKKGEKIEK